MKLFRHCLKTLAVNKHLHSWWFESGESPGVPWKRQEAEGASPPGEWAVTPCSSVLGCEGALWCHGNRRSSWVRLPEFQSWLISWVTLENVFSGAEVSSSLSSHGNSIYLMRLLWGWEDRACNIPGTRMSTSEVYSWWRWLHHPPTVRRTDGACGRGPEEREGSVLRGFLSCADSWSLLYSFPCPVLILQKGGRMETWATGSEDHWFRPGSGMAPNHQDERSRDVCLDGPWSHSCLHVFQGAMCGGKVRGEQSAFPKMYFHCTDASRPWRIGIQSQAHKKAWVTSSGRFILNSTLLNDNF